MFEKNWSSTIMVVFTLVLILLIPSVVVGTSSSPSQKQAISSVNDADIGQLNPTSNTRELLQDMQSKISDFQEQLESQALTIAKQELQIEKLQQPERPAEIIARQELKIQRKELEEFKQLVMKQQKIQAATIGRQELKLQSQAKEIEELKQLVRTQQERQTATTTKKELKIQSQTMEIEGLKQLVTTQQETIDTHDKNMVNQRRRLKQLAGKLKLPLDNMTNEIADMAATIHKANNSHSRISRQVQSGKVAFSAYLNGDLHHLPGGHIIKMKGVNLNEGHAYNPSSGIFTTPHNGVYLFSFSVTQYEVNQVLVTLVVDGSIKSMAVSDPFHSNQNIQGTDVVILRLTTGQQVWTETDLADSDAFLEGDSRWTLTTFSGVFLYP